MLHFRPVALCCSVNLNYFKARKDTEIWEPGSHSFLRVKCWNQSSFFLYKMDSSLVDFQNIFCVHEKNWNTISIIQLYTGSPDTRPGILFCFDTCRTTFDTHRTHKAHEAHGMEHGTNKSFLNRFEQRSTPNRIGSTAHFPAPPSSESWYPPSPCPAPCLESYATCPVSLYARVTCLLTQLSNPNLPAYISHLYLSFNKINVNLELFSLRQGFIHNHNASFK